MCKIVLKMIDGVQLIGTEVSGFSLNVGRKEKQMKKVSQSDVLIELAKLIAKAKREKKWLWQRYHDLWLAPEELTAQNEAGKFIWDCLNWDLRDPMEHLAEAKKRTAAAIAEETNIAERIKTYS